MNLLKIFAPIAFMFYLTVGHAQGVGVPTITAISPASGTTLGGTLITLTGTNLTGATSITLGGVACTTFTVLNPTTATCTTPPGMPGTTSVLVTTLTAISAANTLFTFVAPASSATPIPTLSEWAMILMASLVGLLAFVRLRRR
jgi:hypothetical protein